MTIQEFSNKVNLDINTVFLLIHGNKKVSKNIAIKLSQAFHTSTEVWINLQKNYDNFIINDE